EFGGRIHRQLLAPGPGPYAGMINTEILNSLQMGKLAPYFPAGPEAYFLPQAFAEGAPNHPAYGAGHATVAGACCTILKAFFDESFVIPNPEVPNPTPPTPPAPPIPYSTLMPAPGAPSLTVGGELNKLAANIALGRNAAGV